MQRPVAAAKLKKGHEGAVAVDGAEKGNPVNASEGTADVVDRAIQKTDKKSAPEKANNGDEEQEAADADFEQSTTDWVEGTPDENLNRWASIPLFFTVFSTLFTLYFCWPPEHMWNPPVDHGQAFTNWHWGFPVYDASTQKVQSSFDAYAQATQAPTHALVSSIADGLKKDPHLSIYGPQGSGKSIVARQYVECVAETNEELRTDCRAVKQYNVVLWFHASSRLALERECIALANHLGLSLEDETAKAAVGRALAWMYRQPRLLIIFDDVHSYLSMEDLMHFVPNNFAGDDNIKSRIVHVVTTSKKSLHGNHIKISAEGNAANLAAMLLPADLQGSLGSASAGGLSIIAANKEMLSKQGGNWEVSMKALSESAKDNKPEKAIVKWALQSLDDHTMKALAIASLMWPELVPTDFIQHAMTSSDAQLSAAQAKEALKRGVAAGVLVGSVRAEGFAAVPFVAQPHPRRQTLPATLVVSQSVKSVVLDAFTVEERISTSMQLLAAVAQWSPWVTPTGHPYLPPISDNVSKSSSRVLSLGATAYHPSFYRPDLEPKYQVVQFPAFTTLPVIVETVKFIVKSIPEDKTSTEAQQQAFNVYYKGDLTSAMNVLEVLSQAGHLLNGVFSDYTNSQQIFAIRHSIAKAVTKYPSLHSAVALRDVTIAKQLEGSLASHESINSYHKVIDELNQLDPSSPMQTQIASALAVASAELADLYLAHGGNEGREKAQEWYAKAATIGLIESSMLQGNIRSRFASLHSAIGKHDHSLVEYETAMRIMIKAAGEYTLPVAETLLNMAEQWQNLKRSREAIRIRTKALSVSREILSSSSPMLSFYIQESAVPRLKDKNPRKLRAVHRDMQEAIDIEMEAAGENHPRVLELMILLADSQYQQGILDKSLENYYAIYKMLSTLKGVRDPETVAMKDKCVKLYTHIKQLNEEKQKNQRAEKLRRELAKQQKARS